jgi:type I restriction enzyme, S subunit
MNILQYEQQVPKGWHLARFDEFLKRVERKFFLDDSALYDCVGVRWYGNGAFIRERLLGLNISRKQQWVIKNGDIVYNKLFAWKGSFAIADDSVDGCIVSDKFPTYEADLTMIDSNFLRYYFRTLDLAQQALDLSKGGAAISKLTLNPPQLWDLTIPLPLLSEQRRIVALIEELATKIEEARGLRRETVEEVKILFTSAINEIWFDQSSWNVKTIKDLATLVSGQIDPRIEPYANLPHINGEAIESGTCRLLSYRTAKVDGVTSGKYHFKPGSILYSKIRPYLRKAVQVPVEGICSADVYAFESINPLIDPRFFMYSLISPNFTDYANAISGRTRMPKLNQDQLFSFQMGYPPLSEQHRIVYYLDELSVKIGKLKRLQSEISVELDALIPSVLDKAFKGEL